MLKKALQSRFLQVPTFPHKNARRYSTSHLYRLPRSPATYISVRTPTLSRDRTVIHFQPDSSQLFKNCRPSVHHFFRRPHPQNSRILPGKNARSVQFRPVRLRGERAPGDHFRLVLHRFVTTIRGITLPFERGPRGSGQYVKFEGPARALCPY